MKKIKNKDKLKKNVINNLCDIQWDRMNKIMWDFNHYSLTLSQSKKTTMNEWKNERIKKQKNKKKESK